MAAKFLLPRFTTSLYPADILVVLFAVTLPWSTSLPALFVGLWLLALVPIVDIQAFSELMKRPICWLPIAFFLLGLIGTLWSSVPWVSRLYSVGPLAKLLTVPLLIYHFQRSTRGPLVFWSFLGSCIALMILSWIVTLNPQWALRPDADFGVPVKNYIDQSQEFTLCTVGLVYLAIRLLKENRFGKAGVLATIAAAFVANMLFVTVSRTALITMPMMFGILFFLYMTRRNMILVGSTILILVATAWFTSPNVRLRTTTSIAQYEQYKTSNEPNSIGMRLEFWRKSVAFLAQAPLVGYGTGSVRSLFAQSAIGETGVSAEIIANPHNQTLYAAIQWGAIGIIILYSMWLSHLLMFRGATIPHWIGLLVVAQNIMSSLFNSHLFDFHEGWMYVLGVGVAGGMVLSVKVNGPSTNGRAKVFE